MPSPAHLGLEPHLEPFRRVIATSIAQVSAG
jgi:hypothetical protein